MNRNSFSYRTSSQKQSNRTTVALSKSSLSLKGIFNNLTLYNAKANRRTFIRSDSREMTGNKGEKDATKVPGDVAVHVRHLNYSGVKQHD